MLHKLDLTQDKLRNSCFPTPAAHACFCCQFVAALLCWCSCLWVYAEKIQVTHLHTQKYPAAKLFFLISSDLQIQSNFIYTHPSTKSHWCKEYGIGLWCSFAQRENGLQKRSLLTELCKPVILVIPDVPSGLKQLLLSACMRTQRFQMEVAWAGGLPVSGVILTKHDIYLPLSQGSNSFSVVFISALYLARKLWCSLSDCLNSSNCIIYKTQTQHKLSLGTGMKMQCWEINLVTPVLPLCLAA